MPVQMLFHGAKTGYTGLTAASRPARKFRLGLGCKASGLALSNVSYSLNSEYLPVEPP